MGSNPTGVTKIKYDFVAQLVEHRTFNAGVEGSNPSGITVNVAQLVERLIVIQEVAGS